MNKTKILEEFRKEFATGSGYIRAVTKGSLMNTVPKIGSFLSTTIDTLIGEIGERVEEMKIDMSQTTNISAASVSGQEAEVSAYNQALDKVLTFLATYKQ